MQNIKISHLGISSLKSKGRKMQNNAGFSFVELIIVISILALIAIIGVSMYGSVNEKSNNSKVISGEKTLKSALQNYQEENKKLPTPSGNRNYFKIDSSYAHYENDDAFGVYGSITEKTLPKKYINTIPLDPFSGHYYSYGKTLDNQFFEIASILRENNEAKTKLDGTYPGENGPISLIREYNGPVFVKNNSKIHFPYNPGEHILVAKIYSHGNDIKVNGILVASGSTKQVNSGTQIEVKAGQKAELYFADGSISAIGDDSQDTKITLTDLDYKDKKDNLLTKIKLYLSVGSIFTKATALNPEGSDFEVYTSDTTAAVRGTEFLVRVFGDHTEVTVLKGIVDIYKKPNIDNTEKPKKLEKTELLQEFVAPKQVKVQQGEIISGSLRTLTQEEQNNIKTSFDIFKILKKNIPEGKTITEIKQDYKNFLAQFKDIYEYENKDLNIEENSSDDSDEQPVEENCLTVYNKDGFIAEVNLANQETKELTKKEDILLSDLDIGDKITTRTIKCESGNLVEIGGNTETTITDKQDGMEIYAYAPYNGFDNENINIVNCNDKKSKLDDLFSMHLKNGIKKTPDYSNSFLDWGNGCELGYNNSINYNIFPESLCSTKSEFKNISDKICVVPNGVFIESGDNRYIKYSGLNLGSNFVIEMRVRISNNSNSSRYLFQLGNYKSYIDIYCKILLKNGISVRSTNSFCDGEFHTLVFTKEGNTYKLKIDNQFEGSFFSSNNIGNKLYIGSSNNYNKQINDIIDYIKIYKK